MKLVNLIILFFFILCGPIALAHSENMHLHAIGWNGEYWLIGGRVLPDGPTFLVRWDGEKFSQITPAELRNMWIGNISWSGREWIISEMPATAPGKPKVYAYDGENFSKIERAVEEVQRELYEVCNENYCLIWKNIEGKLLKYDRKHYVDLTGESGLQFPFERVISMAWNGHYWLIGFGGSEGGGVIKYDGTSFTHLSIPTPTAGNAISWNGEYWLVGTVASPRFSGSLVKYDGNAIIDLAPELWRVLEEQELAQPVEEKLTLPSTSEPIIIPREEFPTKHRNLAFAVAAVLLFASYLLWKKRRPRR